MGQRDARSSTYREYRFFLVLYNGAQALQYDRHFYPHAVKTVKKLFPKCFLVCEHTQHLLRKQNMFLLPHTKKW